MSLLVLLVVFALLAAACAAGSDGETIGVASLEDVAGAEVSTNDAADAELSAEDAALEFSQCMRDQGLDFPDVGVDASGNPDIRDAFQTAGIQPGSDDFREAMEVCAELLQGAGFGGGARAALGDDTEVQDAFVEFSECIRDQGFDVGDLQFGGPGSGEGPGDGDDAQRVEGQARGGFGDRNARFAEALGLDAGHPDVEAALDECSPVLDSALAGFGPGAGNAES